MKWANNIFYFSYSFLFPEFHLIINSAWVRGLMCSLGTGDVISSLTARCVHNDL